MIKLCELHRIHNGILLREPPEEDGYECSEAYQTDDINECVRLLWDVAELCDIAEKIRLTKARKVKE
jgi:hypothetical protein